MSIFRVTLMINTCIKGYWRNDCGGGDDDVDDSGDLRRRMTLVVLVDII